MAVGAYAPSFHEGSRSEYLAQYVFSMFGSSAPIPHQEDYGVDLYCTLAERKGQRAWPVAYYSVQIKSGDKPWEFEHPESVRWVVEYPAPLLLCIIDKSEAQVRVYQTMARFGAAVAAKLPDRMALVPGQQGKSRTFSPATDGNFPMGPPILQFNVWDLLDDEKFELFREVLKFWVPDLRRWSNARFVTCCFIRDYLCVIVKILLGWWHVSGGCGHPGRHARAAGPADAPG